MPTISIDVPAAAVPRVKAGFVAYYSLDPAITNAALLVVVQEKLAEYVRSIVKAAESDAARKAAEDGVNVSGVAS